jgi:hypothetical protein
MTAGLRTKRNSEVEGDNLPIGSAGLDTLHGNRPDSAVFDATVGRSTGREERGLYFERDNWRDAQPPAWDVPRRFDRFPSVSAECVRRQFLSPLSLLAYRSVSRPHVPSPTPALSGTAPTATFRLQSEPQAGPRPLQDAG